MKTIAGDGMLLRFATAFSLIPIIVVVVWWPPLKFAYVGMIGVLVLLGAFEFFKMAQQASIEVVSTVTIILAVVLALTTGFSDTLLVAPELFLLIAVFIVLIMHMFSMKHTIAGMSTSVFGLVYVGYLGSFFIRLHNYGAIGPALVTILIVTIGCSDTGAYLIGKAVGKHKLAPRISPKKTVEGSVAALLCGAGAGAILYGLQHEMEWSSYPKWPLGIYMVVGLYLSVVGQFGDLTESLMKRNSGIKDSGSIFPGHGGALDRCDAFLFGAPALSILIHIFELVSI